MSNLSLASSLDLKGKRLKQMAIRSFQNLTTVLLEYPKLARTKDLSSYIVCKNPKEASSLAKKGTGMIFFSGHQANWETLFLDGTKRMKGVAIAKETKNPFLYDWIVSIREKNGGKVLNKKHALKQGFRYLQQGISLGIVGDQAEPDSSFSFPFFGRNTKTSLAPAILAYKANCPIIVATTQRTNYGYEITYSSPIWPDRTKNLRQEAIRMMKQALGILESSIAKAPHEWLWQHNKYRQQNKRVLKPAFRYDTLLFVFDHKHLHLLPYLETFRKIYPDNFFFLFLPKNSPTPPENLKIETTFFYEKEEELWVDDYRFKCVFNFSNYTSIHKHFLKKSVYKVLNYESFLSDNKGQDKDFSQLIKTKLLQKPELFDD